MPRLVALAVLVVSGAVLSVGPLAAQEAPVAAGHITVVAHKKHHHHHHHHHSHHHDGAKSNSTLM